MDGEIQVVGLAPCREDNRYLIIRGSKSRNKVAVGEPAAGSFFRCLQKYLKNKNPEEAKKKTAACSALCLRLSHTLKTLKPFKFCRLTKKIIIFFC